MFRISKNQIIFGGNYFTEQLPPSSCWIVWDKVNGANCFSDCELVWTSYKSPVRMFKWQWSGFFQKVRETRIHPTQKPTGLIELIINKYSKEGDIICDPFAGSGSVLVACIKTGHPYIGFEREESYVKGAQARIDETLAQTRL